MPFNVPHCRDAAAVFDSVSGRIDPAGAADRTAVLWRHHHGEFWKPCPGTTAGYVCCGYQILTPMIGCGMYCDYCILQAYFEHQCQVVYENFADLEREVAGKMARVKGVVRFGTGEFADSLYPEDRLGLCRRIARMLEPYANAVVEFKTKSARVSGLAAIRDPSRVVVGFSLNTPRMIALHERDTAPLPDRLKAARQCLDMGFWIAFHFDPLLWYPEWETEYREVVRRIFDAVADPSRIAWWSMGGFRTTPRLKRILRDQGMDVPLFSGEMVLGEDRKLRYFRPVRVEFYQALRTEAEMQYPAAPLYLCMESPEVWREAGLAERIPNGLVRYLDEKAERMLGAGAGAGLGARR